MPDNNTSDRHRLAELARRKAHTLAMGCPGHDPNRDAIKAAFLANLAEISTP